jgi:diadenosine tetraphosphate (Ap4A) HIT family hydrolase
MAMADPITLALRGENRMVMARMRSGFAVIGDSQFLPGYSLLLSDVEAAKHPTDLPWSERRAFFFDLAILGEAVFNARRAAGVCRINYDVSGNRWPRLHGHVLPRYLSEPPSRLKGPVALYPLEARNAPEYAYNHERHCEMRLAITVELERLIVDAYSSVADARLDNPSY